MCVRTCMLSSHTFPVRNNFDLNGNNDKLVDLRRHFIISLNVPSSAHAHTQIYPLSNFSLEFLFVSRWFEFGFSLIVFVDFGFFYSIRTFKSG